MSSNPTEGERTHELNASKAKVMEHREMESSDDVFAEQSVGQIIDQFIVKASRGPRYVVGCRAKVDKSKLKSGTQVALDMTTLTIMRYLPREVDPTVYQMLNKDAGNVSFSSIGSLNEQIRELREVIELPLTNPDLFLRVGIKPPQGCKTLLVRALACNINAAFYDRKVFSCTITRYVTSKDVEVIRCSLMTWRCTPLRPNALDYF
ncbi:hypothetical protein PsorP6_015519 [Peronosclerospora sorghi]|uniref:Uncharacterized protein n=1 Tax=Peronosclerospora sorghi TaxID=230839 RepID=A0ACC0WPX8_9STRA|nr:hypothetical protein PsorP6_015519 [Peronosclerospora sorghi]